MTPRWMSAVALAAALALAACNPATPTQSEPTAATDLPLIVATATAPPDPTDAPTAAPTEAAPTDNPPADATAPPIAGPVDPANYVLAEVAAGFISPVLVTHAGDGSGRLFVVEKVGTIRIVTADGAVQADPFYDMQGQVTGASEQGLLGLAFSPDYAQDGTFYINYTDLDGHTHVDRCLVADDDANRADACSTVIIIQQPGWNHNGGHLAFGPDGYLYIGMGDGGGGNDPEDRAQDLNDLLGKLLRLDVSGDEAPYTAAPGNPFFGQGQGRAEIWAYGLRNPWRFSFDRATGDLYLGDVGQNAYEELNYQPASSAGGENYGWPYLEALRVNTEAPRAAPDGFTAVPPLLSYAQEVGGCSIVGGYVYRGAALPELDGTYFFSDYCSGQVWAIPAATPNPTVTPWMATGLNVSSFGEDEAGELYVVSLSGAIYRLERGG